MSINLFLLAILYGTRMIITLAVNETQNMNTFWVMDNSWISYIAYHYGNGGFGHWMGLYETIMAKIGDGRIVVELIVQAIAFCCYPFLMIINHPKFKYKYEIKVSEKVSIWCIILWMPVTMILFYKIAL